MSTVTIEEAQARLPELIDRLAPGEELVITRGKQPVAKLIGQAVGGTFADTACDGCFSGANTCNCTGSRNTCGTRLC